MIQTAYDAATVLGSVLGATGILTTGVVSVFKKPKIVNSAVSTERFLKVENKLDAFEKDACRISNDIVNTQNKHDVVVANIYLAISDLRKLVIDLIKET